MPALALLFAITNSALQKQIPANVELDAVQMAISWCEILESHIKRIYQKTLNDPLFAARLLAEKIKGGQVEDQYKIRDICRKNWRHLKSGEQVESAIEKLKEYGWARIEAVQTIGGKSEIIRLNPNLPREVAI